MKCHSEIWCHRRLEFESMLQFAAFFYRGHIEQESTHGKKVSKPGCTLAKASLVRVFIGKETETGLRQIPASTQNHAWIWQTFLFLLYVKATCETCTPATSQNKHGGGLIPWREDGGDSNMGKVGGCWGNWDREHKVLQNLQEPEGGLSLEHSFTAYKKGFYGNHIMHSVHLCECV